ncbi:MAG: cob(I)yrinic acid a,c-diamide adenosyltransferase [Actinobacteria bacterium]|nr:cob(I)yrinic acid a,c-diamide adenosyltransferase [Actinomycetota bacterium]
MDENVLIVLTGEGKGKTSSAVGQAIRYLGAGKKVLFVQFFKPGDSSEIRILKKLGIDVYADSQASLPIDLSDEITIKRQLNLLEKAVRVSSQYQAFVLDEFNLLSSSNIVDMNLLKESLKHLKSQGDVISTGRDAALWLIRMADTVSRILCVKHHFNEGIGAKKGREF